MESPEAASHHVVSQFRDTFSWCYCSLAVNGHPRKEYITGNLCVKLFQQTNDFNDEVEKVIIIFTIRKRFGVCLLLCWCIVENLLKVIQYVSKHIFVINYQKILEKKSIE